MIFKQNPLTVSFQGVHSGVIILTLGGSVTHRSQVVLVEGAEGEFELNDCKNWIGSQNKHSSWISLSTCCEAMSVVSEHGRDIRV